MHKPWMQVVGAANQAIHHGRRASDLRPPYGPHCLGHSPQGAAAEQRRRRYGAGDATRQLLHLCDADQHDAGQSTAQCHLPDAQRSGAVEGSSAREQGPGVPTEALDSFATVVR